MGVDLFRGTVCDSPVVHSVAAGSSMAFGEIRGDRRCRPDDLIGEILQRSRNPEDERDGDAGSFEGLRVGDEAVCRERAVHGHLRVVHALPPSR